MRCARVSIYTMHTASASFCVCVCVCVCVCGSKPRSMDSRRVETPHLPLPPPRPSNTCNASSEVCALTPPKPNFAQPGSNGGSNRAHVSRNSEQKALKQQAAVSRNLSMQTEWDASEQLRFTQGGITPPLEDPQPHSTAPQPCSTATVQRVVVRALRRSA